MVDSNLIWNKLVNDIPESFWEAAFWADGDWGVGSLDVADRKRICLGLIEAMAGRKLLEPVVDGGPRLENKELQLSAGYVITQLALQRFHHFFYVEGLTDAQVSRRLACSSQIVKEVRAYLVKFGPSGLEKR